MALRATHFNEDASDSRDRLLTRAARIRAATREKASGNRFSAPFEGTRGANNRAGRFCQVPTRLN